MNKIKPFLALSSTFLLLVLLSLQFTNLNAQYGSQNTEQIDFRPNDPEEALQQLKNQVENMTYKEISDLLDAAPTINPKTQTDEQAQEIVYSLASYYYYMQGNYIGSSSDQMMEAKYVDMNGDGLLDEVYLDQSSRLFIIFQSAIPGESIVSDSVGNGNFGWAIGDFNNDNLPDLINIMNDPIFSGYLVRFNDGSGLFSPPNYDLISTTNTSLYGFDPEMIETYDLNNDGYDDIVQSLPNGEVHSYLSDGVGEYSTSNQIGEMRSRGALIRFGSQVGNVFSQEQANLTYGWISPGMLNIGIDTIYTNSITSTAMLTYPLSTNFELIGEGEIEIVDIDQNSENDVLIPLAKKSGSTEESEVLIWLQNQGRFVSPISVPLQNKKVFAVEIGDIDLDGQLDVVTSFQEEGNNEIGVEAVLLNENLIPTNHLDMKIADEFYGTYPSVFSVQDYNQDEAPDIRYSYLYQLHNRIVHFNYLPIAFYEYFNYRPIFDDFSDPNSGWPTYSDSSIFYGYNANEYLIINKSSQFLGLAVLDRQYKEYDLSFQGRKTSDKAEGGFGFITDVNDDLSYFQGFVVFPDYSVIWHIQVGSDGRLEVVQSSPVSKLESNGTYEISMSRNWFDDQYSVNMPNGGFSAPNRSYDTNHRVGFITFPLDDFFQARFDNFSLVPKDN